MSLIHYWPMDEAGGATVADTVGNLGNAAILYDPGDVSSFDTGTIFGRARNFVVFEDPGIEEDSAMLNLFAGTPDATYSLPVWSVSLRVMRDGAALDWSNVFRQRDWTEAGNIALQIDEAGGYLYFEVQDSVGDQWDEYTIPASGTIWNGEWRRITITSNGTTVRVYLDGDEVMSVASAVELTPKYYACIGGSYNTSASVYAASGFFSADDAGFYDETLDASFIASSEYLNFPLGYEPPWPSESDLANGSRFSYLDIDDGVLDPVRIPISSWQATLQADRASYVQAVIPSVLDWVDAIGDRITTGEIIITHAARMFDGTVHEFEAARAPLQQFRVSQGPMRRTGTVVGYATTAAGSAATVRVLRNPRSTESAGGLRFRADMDPTLRPGNTVQASGQSFVVSYINFYANETDRYMDVGERAL